MLYKKRFAVIFLVLIIFSSSTISTVNAFGLLEIEDFKNLNQNELEIYLKGLADGINMSMILIYSEMSDLGVKGTAAALEAEGDLIAQDDDLQNYNIENFDKDILKKYEDKDMTFIEILIEENVFE